MNIINKLAEGRIAFSYTKADGSTREAIGTTMESLIPDTVENKVVVQDENSQIITYFDEGKSQFRSFKRENLIESTVTAL